MQRKRVPTKAEAKFRHEEIIAEMKRKKVKPRKKLGKESHKGTKKIDTDAKIDPEETFENLIDLKDQPDVEENIDITTLEDSHISKPEVERSRAEIDPSCQTERSLETENEKALYDREILGNKLWYELHRQGMKLESLSNDDLQIFVMNFSAKEKLDSEKVNIIFAEYLKRKKQVIDVMTAQLLQQNSVKERLALAFKETSSAFSGDEALSSSHEELIYHSQETADNSDTNVDDYLIRPRTPLVSCDEFLPATLEDTDPEVVDKNDLLSQIDLFKQDDDGDTYLHIAVVKDDRSVPLLISLMHHETLDVQNKMGHTPLHLAVIINNQEIVECLVSHGSSVAVMDCNGDTPLHLACRTSDINLVMRLMDRGIMQQSCGLVKAMSTRNYNGEAPLHLAISKAFRSRNTDIIHLLLDFNNDINIVNGNNGKSSLYMALENKNDQIADLLMHKGADINIGTFGGTTPLHIAAQDGNLSLVKTLISKGAYLHAKNADSESAKDVASSDEIKQEIDKAMKKQRRKRQKEKEQSGKTSKYGRI